MEQDSETLADAPAALREFFERIETPPRWFDPSSVHAGCRAFHEYSDLFIPAFFVVTLQNAATLISKAFYMTGRVKTRHGLRRIRQNTRHFIHACAGEPRIADRRLVPAMPDREFVLPTSILDCPLNRSNFKALEHWNRMTPSETR